MARTSTIRISQGRRGTTIRATGGAAQALFEAITGAAAAAKTAVEAQAALAPARKYLLCVRTQSGLHGYTARALVGEGTDEVAVGVLQIVASDEHSDRGAVLQLLAHATPSLRVVHWKEACYSNAGQTIDYTVIAEAR